jgi:EAL domain-containing protein (putative c-di-GMP-specific phosphodiesterase class I)
VVAEGIESQEQAETLQALGCATGQGFLWGQGLPLDELARWLGVAHIPRPRPGECESTSRTGSA